MNWIRNINLSANKTLHLQRWIDLAYIGIFSLSYCVAHGSFLLMVQLVWLAWFEEAKSMCITIFSCIGNSRTKSPTHPHSQHLLCIAECSHSDQSVFFGKKWKSEAALQEDTWHAPVLEYSVHRTRLRCCDVNPQMHILQWLGSQHQLFHTTDLLLLGCSTC